MNRIQLVPSTNMLIHILPHYTRYDNLVHGSNITCMLQKGALSLNFIQHTKQVALSSHRETVRCFVSVSS